MDADLRAALKQRVDAERRRRVPLPEDQASRGNRALACWEAADGNPLGGLELALWLTAGCPGYPRQGGEQ